MTKHTRTASPVPDQDKALARFGPMADGKATRRAQRQADALLDAAAPLRYVPSMGKRLRQSEWSDSMKKAAHAAMIAWNKP